MVNMNNMMKQVQKMQKDMQKAQADLEASEFTASDHNHLVEVTVNGKKQVLRLEIQPELVDPEDPDMLEDILIATLNEAFVKVDQATEEKMGRFTQGLNLPF